MRHGYEAVLLAGGATGQIGDPKENEERELKAVDEVEVNVRAIEGQLRRIVGEDFELVNNNDWFLDMRLIPFLREVGKQFSMTQLLDRKFVQDRIGEGGVGISYAEFSYSLIQGYDFLHLYREKGVSLQLCGADQFGNSVSGMHLVRRLEGARVDVWGCPLIIDKVSGRKFGKSEGNAAWLSAEMTSVFDFYQFWLNQPDDGVENYLKIYTEIGPEELAELMREHGVAPQERLAQKRLAADVVRIVHGEGAMESVVKITTVLFGAEKVAELGEDDMALLAESIPVAERGAWVTEVLVGAGIAKSKTEARQLIDGGAILVNNEKIDKDTEVGERAIIKKGKNKFVLVK